MTEYPIVNIKILKGSRKNRNLLESRMKGNFHVRFGKGFLTNDLIGSDKVGVNLLFHNVNRSAYRYKSV